MPDHEESSAWAVLAGWGQAGTNNSGPHGFSEIHYAFTSGAANNGSAFAGLGTAATFYQVTGGVVMLIRRSALPVLVLCLSIAVDW